MYKVSFFKNVYCNNKWIMIGICISIIVGYILAISKIDIVGNNSKGNIIILIQNNNFKFGSYILKAILCFSIIYISIIFLNYHFYLFCGNFLLFTFIIKVLLTNIFISCVVDGISAYIELIIFWIPVSVYSILCYFYAMSRIYNYLGFDTCKKKALFIPSYKKLIKLIYKIYFAHILPVFCYFSFYVIIVNVII